MLCVMNKIVSATVKRYHVVNSTGLQLLASDLLDSRIANEPTSLGWCFSRHWAS